MEDLIAPRWTTCSAFFDAYYAPSNATLALAGDFEPEQAKKLIEHYFGTAAASARARPGASS